MPMIYDFSKKKSRNGEKSILEIGIIKLKYKIYF